MKKFQRQNGFTLIEMAIVIIITGLVLASAASAYSLYLKDKTIKDTNNNTAAVIDAIGAFRSAHGRYPCPASLTIARDAPGYGMETDCENTVITPVAGACDNPLDGICIQTSSRSIAYQSGGTVLPAENPRVRVGFIPFRTLNLSEREAYDGHRTRLKYVVTERLAVDQTFMADGGGIEILNDQNESMFIDDSMAHFLVISHGENKAGGYTAYGSQIPCDSAGIDAENCIERPDAVYRLTESNTSTGAGHFDDLVRYFTKSDVPLWQLSEDDKWDIHQKPPGYVSFLSSPTTPLTESLVAGKVRAEQVLVDEVCATDGSNCFPSSVIGGQLAESEGIQCPNPNQFVAGIENNGPICVDEVVVTCDPGEIMTGIDADGTLICSDAPCPATTVTICGGNASLPAASDGDEETVTGGDNAFQVYRCDSGAWGPVGPQGGSCICVPDSEDRTRSCPNGLSGNIEQRRTLECPAGTWSSWSEIANNCTCTPDSETRTEPCPSGFAGSVEQTRTFTCPDATWSGWVTVSDTCVCEPDSENRTQRCPSGLTGNIVEERQHLCPAATWTAWTEISNTCTCTPRSSTRKRNCPSGLSGEIQQRQDFICPDASWTAWYETSNTCACVPRSDETRTISCPTGYTGSIEQERSFTCPDATWSAWTETSNSCTCTDTTETRDVACPTGYIGTVREARAFNCSSGRWSNWSEVSNDCRVPPPAVCRWVPSGSPQTSQPFGLGEPAYTNCTCGTPSEPCHSGSSGSYSNYSACSCQE